MKTIWVVEKGGYSDYSVLGLFTSKERAQTICDYVNGKHAPGGDYAATIAEWPLDPAIDELAQGMTMWNVHMDKNGNVERAANIISTDFDSDAHIWARRTAPYYVGRGDQYCNLMVASVWAKDQKHAIKIVNEKRAEWIAMGKWVD